MQHFELYDKVKDDTIIYNTDSVSYSFVYVGFISNMKKVDLVWHEDKELSKYADMKCSYLTLKEIKEQCSKITGHDNENISVFFDDPQRGYIFSYGNNGEDWICAGVLAGYW